MIESSAPLSKQNLIFHINMSSFNTKTYRKECVLPTITLYHAQIKNPHHSLGAYKNAKVHSSKNSSRKANKHSCYHTIMLDLTSIKGDLIFTHKFSQNLITPPSHICILWKSGNLPTIIFKAII